MVKTWTPIGSAFVFSAHEGGSPLPVGQIAIHGNGFAFKYANSWLERPTAFAVDPINLPLGDQQFSSPKIWGVFEDGTPDSWGRRVLLATHTQHPQNDIEWLIASRGAGAGCLLYSASRTQLPALHQPPGFEDLEKLLRLTAQIQNGDIDATPEMTKLLSYGSSMGGARPKVTIIYQGAEWIAKLDRSDDLFNQPRAEFASLNMASDAGIPTPGHELVEIAGRSVLLVPRFDRIDNVRAHYLSAFAAIHPVRVRVGDTEGPLSYLKIADVLKKVSDDAGADCSDLFRRMVFNVLIGNTDDHLKNHGFIMNSPTTYALSPAFDLLPHPGQLGLQALTVGKYDRTASVENLLSECARFGLRIEHAREIMSEVYAVTQHAEDYFDGAGMSRADIAVVAGACSHLNESVERALTRKPQSNGPRY